MHPQTHLQLVECHQQLVQPFHLIPQRLQLRDVHLWLQLLPQRLQLVNLGAARHGTAQRSRESYQGGCASTAEGSSTQL
jgi:hypothetical protein